MLLDLAHDRPGDRNRTPGSPRLGLLTKRHVTADLDRRTDLTQIRDGARRRCDGSNQTITRMRCCPATKDYVARRRAEGKSSREIQRCLKCCLGSVRVVVSPPTDPAGRAGRLCSLRCPLRVGDARQPRPLLTAKY